MPSRRSGRAAGRRSGGRSIQDSAKAAELELDEAEQAQWEDALLN
ncbi:hypothetical protein ACFUN7_27775 [Streptomyces sp. NPDC057236]